MTASAPAFWLCRANPAEADEGTRTPDPLLTMEVLYQLSYVGARSHPTVRWIGAGRRTAPAIPTGG
jgi:hypothetical protein